MHILGAEGRGRVHQPGAIIGGHIFLQHHVVRRLVRVQESEQRLVAAALKLLSFKGIHHVYRFIAEDLFHQRLRQDQALAPPFRQRALDCHIIYFRMGRYRHIARQRPGCGRPHQQRGARLIHQRHAHIDGRVIRIAIPQRHLVIGERRAAARAVGHHFIALIKQALIPEILQNPPQRLDIVVGIGDIRLVKVNPIAHPVGKLLPFLDQLESRFAAQFVETVDAIRLDLAFIGKAKLFLHADLDRQTVRIPPAAPHNVITLHQLIAREDILESACQGMVHAGFAVGSRRPFIEHIVVRPLRCLQRPLLAGFGEDAVQLPEIEHFLFEQGDLQLRRDGFEHVVSSR